MKFGFRVKFCVFALGAGVARRIHRSHSNLAEGSKAGTKQQGIFGLILVIFGKMHLLMYGNECPGFWPIDGAVGYNIK